jgi:ABC-type antimicrobial peptide transport system permease subunit
VYGVVAYSVRQRTRELGIRAALGATRTDIVRLVLGEGMAVAAVGLAIGMAGALALTRLLRAMLYGVTATDPAVFSAILALLGAVALAASWIPARAAARVEAMEVLRGD